MAKAFLGRARVNVVILFIDICLILNLIYCVLENAILNNVAPWLPPPNKDTVIYPTVFLGRTIKRYS